MPSACEQTFASASSSPVRPHLPLLCACAIVLWVCQAIAFSLAKHDKGLTEVRIVIVFAIVCATLLVVAILVPKRKGIAVVSAFAALGVVVGIGGAAALYTAHDELNEADEAVGWHLFTLEEDSARSPFGSKVRASTVLEGVGTLGIQLYFEDDVSLYRGQMIAADTPIKGLDADELVMYFDRGVVGKANVRQLEMRAGNPLLDWLIQRRIDAIEAFATYAGSQSGILQALVCGYRNTMSDDGSYEAYKVCGIAHIVAVSGAHLAIVAMLLSWLFVRLQTSRTVRIVLISCFLAAYLVFAGMPISAIRACVMVVLGLISFAFRRRQATLNALGISVIFFLVGSPVACVSVSLFLSAASTCGIVLFAPLFSSWFSFKDRILKRYVVEPLSLTLASNVMTLPFSAALFSQLSLVALPANLIATPLFSAACISGLISSVVGLVFPVALPAMMALSSALAAPLSWFVHMMSSIPYACIAVSLPVIAMIALSAVASFSLWFFWPKIRRRTAIMCAGISAVLLVCFVFIRFPVSDRICMLDVGQGDAFLVQSESASVLIDTGNSDSKLREGLARYGVRKLDAVFITHPDDDHCASLSSVFDYARVDTVYVAADLLTCECDACGSLRDDVVERMSKAPVGLEVSDKVMVGRFSFEVVWPQTFTDEGGNADSLCMVASIDENGDGICDCRALFCGDAEADQLEEMLDDATFRSIDILKVGHHGSKVALTEDLAKVLSPKLALLSVGKNNRYGHPSSEVLEQLESAGSQVFRTDEMGCVEIDISSEGINIVEERAHS